MKVLKFGGKSLDSSQKIENICEYIGFRAQKEKIIVVVSAFGGETDQLIEKASEYNENSREMDALISTGEIKAASLVAMALESRGVKAQSFSAAQVPILTMGSHRKSIIISIDRTNIQNCLDSGRVAVVAGFQGINQKGDVTTLGRGGSDTTAIALASVFDCEAELYSDFEGVQTGDPRHFKYKLIPRLSHSDLKAYSESGAKVVAPNAAAMAQANNVPLLCKSSAAPFKKGTKVTKLKSPFVAISTSGSLSKININFTGTNFDPQKVISYILSNVNYNSINITQHSISLLLPSESETMVEKEIAQLSNLLVDE